MVRHEGPGIHRQVPLPAQRGESGHEIGPVGVLPKDLGALDAPAPDVVEGVWPKVPDAVRKGIEPGLSRHAGMLRRRPPNVKAL